MKLDRSNWTIYYNETFSFWVFFKKMCAMKMEEGKINFSCFMFCVTGF